MTMRRFLVVSTTDADELTKVDACVSDYLERALLLNKDVQEPFSPQFRTIVTDTNLYKVKRVFPREGWAPLEDYRKTLSAEETDDNRDESTSDGEILLADVLHDVADSLPYTGSSLRAVLFDNDAAPSPSEEQSDHFIPLAGALRRLREWHNGQVTLVVSSPELHASREDLVDLGQCQVVASQDRVPLDMSSWEGKVAVVDRIEDKGHVFGGHTLNSDQWDQLLQRKVTPLPCAPMKRNVLRKRQRPGAVKPPAVTHPVCGRTVEVLQEVDLRTFPVFLLDSWTLTLNVQEGHSDVLMKYIQEAEQVGLLARLRVYPDSRAVPCCGSTNSLNTGAWKRKILENSCEEPPEKAVANEAVFLYLLLLPPGCPEPGTEVAPPVVARVVLSPREINRQVVRALEEQALREGDQPGSRPADLTCDARVLYQKEAFTNLLRLVKEHRKNTAKEIYGRTKGVSKTAAEEIKQDILKVAAEVEDKIMTLAFQEYPTLTEYMQQRSSSYPPTSVQWISEASLDPTKFPEKMALQAKVARKTELQGHTSTDSLLGSSPITLEEMEKKRHTTDFDINDILRMFNKDGTPLPPPFTPEKLEGRNLCRVDSTPDLNTPWPNSQSLQFHDIYYYIDENDLGLEKKYSKIRDKVLDQDTLCTFVSPQKKKPQPLRKISPVRSSPRRRNSAQHLMTRNRSDSVKSTSFTQARAGVSADVFKQPRLSLRSPASRRLSLSQGAPGSGLTSSQSHSGSRHSHGRTTTPASTPRSATSHTASCSRFDSPSPAQRSIPGGPVSHSTPLSSLPTRVSPRKRVLSRSFSSAHIPSSSLLPSRHVDPAQLGSASKLQSSLKRQTSASLSSKASPGLMSTSGGKMSQRPLLARSLTSDTLVRRSPRKSLKTALESSKYVVDDRSMDAGSPLERRGSTTLNTPPVLDMDESSTQSQPGSEQARRKRSLKHKQKLKSIIADVLHEKGVKETDMIYAACSKNLFNVSLVLLKTLTTSQNLTEEMNTVVQAQVTQIISLEKRRCGISL